MGDDGENADSNEKGNVWHNASGRSNPFMVCFIFCIVFGVHYFSFGCDVFSVDGILQEVVVVMM